MQRPILNLDEDLDWAEYEHGTRFGARHAPVAARLGAKKLGYGVFEIPPGKRPFPYHAHMANEEMYVVLEGSGTLRLDGQEFPIRRGDVVALPPGPRSAHQLINDSEAPLRVLAVSTMEEPDVIDYPDSAKYGVMAGSPPGGEKALRTVTFFAPKNAAVDYFYGETDAEGG